jgi:hypothetical protein
MSRLSGRGPHLETGSNLQRSGESPLGSLSTSNGAGVHVRRQIFFPFRPPTVSLLTIGWVIAALRLYVQEACICAGFAVPAGMFREGGREGFLARAERAFKGQRDCSLEVARRRGHGKSTRGHGFRGCSSEAPRRADEMIDSFFELARRGRFIHPA